MATLHPTKPRPETRRNPDAEPSAPRRSVHPTLGRLLAIAAVLSLFAVQAFALDVGGFLESTTSFQQDGQDNSEFGFQNVARLYVSRNPQISGPLTLRWRAQVSAGNSFDVTDGQASEEQWVFDADQLDLRWTAPDAFASNSVFRGSVGRFAFTDTSGLIFDDRIDGLSLSLDFPSVTTSVSGGYTGLLTKENSAIQVSGDDAIDALDDNEALAPPRIVSGLSFIFPEIIGRQSASVEALAQWDARERYTEEKVDTQYIYMTGNGPVSEKLYYDFALVGNSTRRFANETGDDTAERDNLSDAEQEFGIAGHLRSQLFLDTEGRNLVTGLVRYGSGGEGDIDPFTPVAPQQPDLLAPAGVADTTLFLLDYSFNPFAGRNGAASRRLELSAYGTADYSARPAEGDAYRGTEAGARVTARPFSDFGAKLHGATRYNAEDNTFSPFGKIELSASF